MTVAHAIITSHGSARERAHFFSFALSSFFLSLFLFLFCHFLHTVFAFPISRSAIDGPGVERGGKGSQEREDESVKSKGWEEMATGEEQQHSFHGWILSCCGRATRAQRPHRRDEGLPVDPHRVARTAREHLPHGDGPDTFTHFSLSSSYATPPSFSTH